MPYYEVTVTTRDGVPTSQIVEADNPSQARSKVSASPDTPTGATVGGVRETTKDRFDATQRDDQVEVQPEGLSFQDFVEGDLAGTAMPDGGTFESTRAMPGLTPELFQGPSYFGTDPRQQAPATGRESDFVDYGESIPGYDPDPGFNNDAAAVDALRRYNEAYQASLPENQPPLPEGDVSTYTDFRRFAEPFYGEDVYRALSSPISNIYGRATSAAQIIPTLQEIQRQRDLTSGIPTDPALMESGIDRSLQQGKRIPQTLLDFDFSGRGGMGGATEFGGFLQQLADRAGARPGSTTTGGQTTFGGQGRGLGGVSRNVFNEAFQSLRGLDSDELSNFEQGFQPKFGAEEETDISSAVGLAQQALFSKYRSPLVASAVARRLPGEAELIADYEEQLARTGRAENFLDFVGKRFGI
tara:strand:+ start:34 stop:1272 length:1239 start_codon:yes stop_codon:yes gene_type:complete